MPDDVPLYESRYPGYDVLAQAEDWDEVTRALVLRRVREVPPIRFFNEVESQALQALADTFLPQDDRPPELRVPLVNALDERLHVGEGEGYRVDSLPPDPEFWRTLAAALDEEARLAFRVATFTNLTRELKQEVARRIHDEALRQTLEKDAWADFGVRPLFESEDGGWTTPAPEAPPLLSPLWRRLVLKFGFVFILWEFARHYYAHPYAWSEIGFGGPRFPRIYARTLRDNPTEAEEVRLEAH